MYFSPAFRFRFNEILHVRIVAPYDATDAHTHTHHARLNQTKCAALCVGSALIMCVTDSNALGYAIDLICVFAIQLIHRHAPHCTQCAIESVYCCGFQLPRRWIAGKTMGIATTARTHVRRCNLCHQMAFETRVCGPQQMNKKKNGCWPTETRTRAQLKRLMSVTLRWQPQNPN